MELVVSAIIEGGYESVEMRKFNYNSMKSSQVSGE